MMTYIIFHIIGSIIMGIIGFIVISKDNEIAIGDIGTIILMMSFTWIGLLLIVIGYLIENSDKVLFEKDIEGKWSISESLINRNRN